MHRTHHAHDGRGAVRRGFSLIEVMMATVILGLGILGLLALFAGTARQQQIASEATDSLLITGNAQAIIGSQVGRLSDADDDITTGPLSDFEPDVWYAMTAEGMIDDERQLGPRGSDGATDLFFLTDIAIPGGTYTLYSGSPDEWDDGISSGFCAGGLGQFGNADFEFPAPRLEPCSLRSIEVEIVDYNPVTGEETPIETRTYNLTFFGTGTQFNDVAHYTGDTHLFSTFTGVPGGPCGLDRRPSDPTPSCLPTDDFITLNLATTTGMAPRAFIENMQIRPLRDLTLVPGYSAPANPRVKSITAQAPFQFRQTDVVSLSSRLNYTVGSDGVRVPEFGYSLLFRLSDDGRTEVMVASYAIRPTQAGTEFVPMEDFMSVYSSLSNARNSDGPLQQVQVELGYDMTEEMHYIEVANADDFWAVEPGNVVLVQGNATNGATPGSELSTTVVSQRVIDDTTRRGFLDRAPRNNGSILLPDLNMTIDTFVWGVQPTVESEADESVWSLRAVAIEPISLSGRP